MKVVTYNIQYGLGKDRRYDLARVAREVADAELIALQEVERHWQRSGDVDGPAVLASHLPEHHWVYGANLDMDASRRDAAGTLVNRRRQFGTMILSRLPIVFVAQSPAAEIRHARAAQHPAGCARSGHRAADGRFQFRLVGARVRPHRRPARSEVRQAQPRERFR